MDGELVEVAVDWTGLPPRYLRRPVLALDETAETAWWVHVRYARAPFWRLPRPGEPWRYFHCPPSRRDDAQRHPSAS